MGFSSKKQNTSSVQDLSSHATTTPNVPQWLLDPAQQLAGNLGGFIKQGPGAYTPQTSALQTQAFNGAGNLSTSPLYGEAAGMVRGANTHFDGGTVNGQSLLDGLDKYYNPYKDQVLNPVMADYDVNAGKTRAAQAAQGASTGAFRGSRFAVREGETEGNLARGRASTEGGLLHDMFDTATGLSSQDAARRQSAMEGNAARSLTAQTAGTSAAQAGAGLLSGFADAQGGADRANLGVQDLLGQQETDQGNAQRQFPLDYQGKMEGFLSGLDPATYSGQTIDSTGHNTGSGSTTDNPSGADQYGKFLQTGAQVMAMLGMSDERVKTDVRTHHHDAKGRRWVTFAYIWAPLVRFYGLIAQEVRRTDPQAVHTGPGGVLQVDYGALA